MRSRTSYLIMAGLSTVSALCFITLLVMAFLEGREGRREYQGDMVRLMAQCLEVEPDYICLERSARWREVLRHGPTPWKESIR